VEALTIGRLARLGGVNLETIRYNEREGLLQKPPRTPAGYRLFPSENARRLIKRAQELSFSLGEIRQPLALRMKPGTKRQHTRGGAEAKVVDIEQKIRTLQAMKKRKGRSAHSHPDRKLLRAALRFARVPSKALRKMTNRCEGGGPLAECPILESLDEESS
jgi:MerR family mercuric resistance operon transcriptional regulator